MDLTIRDDQSLALKLREERRQQIKTKSKAANTLKMLETNIRRFQSWCEENQLRTLPASTETVCDYLIHLADSGRKVSTLQSAAWAIGKAHSQSGQSNPCETVEVKDHLAGIKRLLAEAKSNQARIEKKGAFTIEEIRTCRFEDSLLGKRDKALLLIGFAGGFRRSELAGISVEDITDDPRGLMIHLHQTKSNQDADVPIVKGKVPAWCPVIAFKKYLEASGIESGPLFRSIRRGNHLTAQGVDGVTINRIVKKYVEQLGFDPADYGAHSLRAGCATFFLENGAAPYIVQKHLRHKSFNTTQEYNRGEISRGLEGIY